MKSMGYDMNIFVIYYEFMGFLWYQIFFLRASHLKDTSLFKNSCRKPRSRKHPPCLHRLGNPKLPQIPPMAFLWVRWATWSECLVKVQCLLWLLVMRAVCCGGVLSYFSQHFPICAQDLLLLSSDKVSRWLFTSFTYACFVFSNKKHICCHVVVFLCVCDAAQHILWH